MRPLAAALLATCALTGVARAADPGPVRITVISDQDDDIYDARAGRGGVDATRMAVADFGGTVLGRQVIVDALNDHNKAALAPGLANQALDAGADLLMDVQNSPIAIAVGKAAADHHRIAISTGSAVPALTRGACNKYVYHYSFDSVSIASATANYVAGLPDAKQWVALTADAGFGKGAAATMQPVVTAHGGTVDSILVPPSSSDVSSLFQQVREAHPDVVAVLNAGAPNDQQVAQVTGAKLATHLTTGLLYLSDVERMGEGYTGITAAVPWYWNLDATARAWADRFAAAHDGARPTAAQAADYSATTQWLQAVRTAGTTDADAVVQTLDDHTFDDMFARHAMFRGADHMVVHDLYIAQVLPLANAKEPGERYRIVATVPAQTAFPANGACKMVR